MVRKISIIICTKDRLASLQRTLEAFESVRTPDNSRVELLVVDNGSTDGTADYLSAASKRLTQFEFQVLKEPKPGKSRALNLAISVAEGDVLLFTDDDVRPPPNWIEGMCEPIWSDSADAVAGGVRLPETSEYAHLSLKHRGWLAITNDAERRSERPALIGANMALSRRVFELVPGFDLELGPGGIGHEDVLFWLQVLAAGLRIVARHDLEVEHCVATDRLGWMSFDKQARRRGEFDAYIEHHWEHFERRHPFLGFTQALVRLWFTRLVHCISWVGAKRMPEWELDLLERCYTRRRMIVERCRPRNYAHHGLVRVIPYEEAGDRVRKPASGVLDGEFAV